MWVLTNFVLLHIRHSAHNNVQIIHTAKVTILKMKIGILKFCKAKYSVIKNYIFYFILFMIPGVTNCGTVIPFVRD